MKHVATVQNDINMATDDGMFIARTLGAFAAMESDRKSQRVKRKAREIAEAGRCNGGIRPFGYEKGGLLVREDEASVIRDLAARYLAGESLMSVTTGLIDAGFKTVANGPWRTGVVRQLLTSPHIAGLRSHNGVVVAKAVWPGIILEEQP